MISLIFGTDTGKTRKIVKKIHKMLGSDDVAKPININRCSIDDLLEFDNLIIGTPTFNIEQLAEQFSEKLTLAIHYSALNLAYCHVRPIIRESCLATRFRAQQNSISGTAKSR